MKLVLFVTITISLKEQDFLARQFFKLIMLSNIFRNLSILSILTLMALLAVVSALPTKKEPKVDTAPVDIWSFGDSSNGPDDSTYLG